MTNATIHEETKRNEYPYMNILSKFGHRDGDGCAISLRVMAETKGFAQKERTTGRWIVGWSMRRGGGWGKRYEATFATKEAALAFAESKWDVMKGILAKHPVEQRKGGGAAEAFSASLYGMQR